MELVSCILCFEVEQSGSRWNLLNAGITNVSAKHGDLPLKFERLVLFTHWEFRDDEIGIRRIRIEFIGPDGKPFHKLINNLMKVGLGQNTWILNCPITNINFSKYGVHKINLYFDEELARALSVPVLRA